jgi:hypothetical protein
MTPEEVQPYVGKAVRIQMADGEMLAGTLHMQGDPGGHGHIHYAVVSDPVEPGGAPVGVMIHGPGRIATIELAGDDPAAVETPR